MEADVESREALERGRPATRVVAVGGGKGGVGKTVLTANLAVALARGGHSVVAVDADLEGANLHTCLGVPPPRASLADFAAEREEDLVKLAVDTPVARLRLIAGTDGNLGSPQPSAERRVRLLRALRRLPADFALMDLGAGTQGPTLDYFLAADDAVVLLVPEPTSVENAYTFLRAAFYRRLSLAMVSCGARDLVDEAMDQRNERGIRTPLDLLREVESLDPALGARFAEVVRGFHPRLIVNGVRTAEDVKLGFSIRTVCRKYFGIETDYLGYVSHDDEVRRSVRERRPLLGGDPPSDAAMYLQRIARKLSGAASARAPVAAGAPA